MYIGIFKFKTNKNAMLWLECFIRIINTKETRDVLPYSDTEDGKGHTEHINSD